MTCEHKNGSFTCSHPFTDPTPPSAPKAPMEHSKPFPNAFWAIVSIGLWYLGYKLLGF